MQNREVRKKICVQASIADQLREFLDRKEINIEVLTGVSVSQMGKLLDYLDVKIRRCSLGCFQ